jgi:Ran GTPase-activating protein (RanGAP) involved in mRNA processing and transport
MARAHDGKEMATVRTLSDVMARAHDESLERVLLSNQFHALEGGPFLADLHLDKLQGEEPQPAARDLSGHDVHELARVLPTLRNLRTLLLSCNTIGDDGTQEICAALAGHPSLLRLGLSFAGIGDGGAEHLAKLIRANGRITSINLYGNHFTEQGALVIEGALGESLSITDLNISNNRCKDDEGVAARLRALSRKPVLERADVHDQWELDVRRQSVVVTEGDTTRMLAKASANAQAAATAPAPVLDAVAE